MLPASGQLQQLLLGTTKLDRIRIGSILGLGELGFEDRRGDNDSDVSENESVSFRNGYSRFGHGLRECLKSSNPAHDLEQRGDSGARSKAVV